MMRARPGDQRGVALVAALAVLLVVTLLSAAAVMVAVHSSGSSTRDASTKRALEAAEAGLRVATYRVNMLTPSDTTCVTNAAVAPAGNGQCPQDGPEDLTGGESFKYWTTTPNPSACAGMTLVAQTSIAQRCVTSIGTADGITRRVQARIAAFGALPLFPVGGIFGTFGVSVANNATVNAAAGTNGALTINNNAHVNGSYLGPSGTLSVGNNGSGGTVTKRTTAQGPYVLGPVDPGNSATVNDNARIPNGQASPKVVPYDQGTGVTYTPATRTLTVSNNGSLTLTGGLYNFCDMTVSNNAVVSIGAGVRAVIFIDSPDRAGSSCPAGSGNITVNNNSSLANNFSAGDPTALQLYVYGTPLSNKADAAHAGNIVTLSNNGVFYGSIFAPNSTVNMSNNTAVYGGIAAAWVNLQNNFTFNWDGRDTSLQARAQGLYYRTAWRECPPAPTTSGDPASGCI